MKQTFLSAIMATLFWLLKAQLLAAPIEVQHLEPAFWWAGMHNPELQIMLHGKDISTAQVEIEYPGVTLKESVSVENPNYLFLYLNLDPQVKPGQMQIKLTQGRKSKWISYTLLPRNQKTGAQGFDSHDVMYLITPDRFSDGDLSNNLPEAKVDRSNAWVRHGGDVRGVINHLDYLSELGITSVWLNPVVSNAPHIYHGYAINDFYNIDPCYGTLDEYIEFVDETHKRDMKVVMDMIFNHCGADHWWMQDLPTSDWLNNHNEYIGCNHNKWTVVDPYASPSEKRGFHDGWFSNYMPDLNGSNRNLSTYLIQNSIWWIEHTRIDGIRQDTHPYADPQFMSRWCKAINDEYPSFNIVGETWYPVSPAFTAWWQKGSKLSPAYESNLKTVMDFNLMFVSQTAFDDVSKQDEQHSKGLFKIYESLAQDFLYEDPNQLLIFLDNHDVSRFNHQGDRGLSKFQQGMAFLMTTRGIPQIYYGCELMMHGEKSEGDGFIRKDFPGGFAGDSRDAFTAAGRTAEENAAHDYLQRLLQWRKHCTAVTEGSLMHFIPDNDNGCYVYARSKDEQIVLVVLNGSDAAQHLDVARYADAMQGRTAGTNVLTGERIDLSKTIDIEARGTLILELTK